MQLWSHLRAGFRWWMVPALLLLVFGAVGLVALSGLATAPARSYSAL